MPRILRYLPDEALIEVACRPLHGRALAGRVAGRSPVLAGGGAVAVLARAQRRTAMGVCAFVDLPDQSHLLL
ncbi:MAG: hypothetical protein OEP45_13010, partial [Acidobacteriota bacterium]|nr:hypothetical protein [Acidobacteriota bacterium]